MNKSLYSCNKRQFFFEIVFLNTKVCLYISVGPLVGGFIVSKFNLKKSLKKSAFCCIVGQILVFVVPLAYLLPGCGNVNLAGLVVDYGET